MLSDYERAIPFYFGLEHKRYFNFLPSVVTCHCFSPSSPLLATPTTPPYATSAPYLLNAWCAPLTEAIPKCPPPSLKGSPPLFLSGQN